MQAQTTFSFKESSEISFQVVNYVFKNGDVCTNACALLHRNRSKTNTKTNATKQTNKQNTALWTNISRLPNMLGYKQVFI